MQDSQKIANRDQVVQTLARHSISPTRQRVEIGLLLFGGDRHVTADQLLEEVNSSGESAVSKATVYNTLGLFAEKGLLREVIVDPSRVIYDTNVTDHHHTFNVETGELRDIPREAVDLKLSPELAEKMIVDGVDVIVRFRSKP